MISPTTRRIADGKNYSRPKSLAERLEWMAANLPGFREELDLVQAAMSRVAGTSSFVTLIEQVQSERSSISISKVKA